MQNIEKMYSSDFLLEEQPDKSLIKFKAGNTLIVDHIAGELKLVSKNQTIQLIIKVHGETLEVHTNASQLSINATDELNISAKKINIEATEQVNIKTAGNLVMDIAKDCLTEIAGTNKSIARIQKLTASLGNVEIKANDDVKLDGESVKLNCEEP